MKFCPVVPEICHGQVHASQKERIRIIRIKNKKIKIRNGAKTISLQTLLGRLNKNNNKKRSKNNKSPKLCLRDLITISLLLMSDKLWNDCYKESKLKL